LMLALAGALTLFSVLAEHLASTAAATQGGQRTQGAEMQPAALTYFRVMDWLAQFMPGGPVKTAAVPAAAPSARLMDRSGSTPSTPVRLCSLRVRANSSGEGRVSTASTSSMFVSASVEN
jgi:hypothetical protein